MLGHLRRRETQPAGANPWRPFGLRAAQVHLLRCPSLPMLGHGLCRFALHLHPRRPQRGSWDFHHGLLVRVPPRLLQKYPLRAWLPARPSPSLFLRPFVYS